MVTEQAILMRLRNGEKADDIANEMINMLNKANQTYTDEQVEQHKAELCATMSNALNEYVALIAPQFKDFMTPERMQEILDHALGITDMLLPPFHFVENEDIIANILNKLKA